MVDGDHTVPGREPGDEVTEEERPGRSAVHEHDWRAGSFVDVVLAAVDGIEVVCGERIE
jgi:hypothetical protein